MYYLRLRTRSHVQRTSGYSSILLRVPQGWQIADVSGGVFNCCLLVFQESAILHAASHERAASC